MQVQVNTVATQRRGKIQMHNYHPALIALKRKATMNEEMAITSLARKTRIETN
jgi:hypothetical protein